MLEDFYGRSGFSDMQLSKNLPRDKINFFSLRHHPLSSGAPDNQQLHIQKPR